ncbi:hypothetical protein [Anditalea andensis]|uniref:Outer membrane protein beta-barrel domain-containing protein n=1 Tax=Anditalea andensis TaxID=1048983 RepID=A0A074KTT3_9BACT|nr:hypothetical protein [Anditalea andensis]KEO72324.1 hypothetical protein EL17_16380 [Anditalea andensis]
MKKHLFVILFIWLWPVINVSGQTSESQWVLFSEFSPYSRTGENRILPNSREHSNLEWRNRIGKMVNSHTALGLILNYRHYNYNEPVTYLLENPSSSFSYQYSVKNSLLGTGAFMTRFFQIHKRIQLQASLYGVYEWGEGSYTMTLQDYQCAGCFTNGLNFGVRTGDIENQTLKERNFFGGLDFSVSYAISPRINLLTGINLLQYENYSISEGKRIAPTLGTSVLYRQLNVKEYGISTIFDRPIMHFGIVVSLPK